jgi:hypothetical protein
MIATVLRLARTRSPQKKSSQIAPGLEAVLRSYLEKTVPQQRTRGPEGALGNWSSSEWFSGFPDLEKRARKAALPGAGLVGLLRKYKRSRQLVVSRWFPLLQEGIVSCSYLHSPVYSLAAPDPAPSAAPRPPGTD